MSRTLWKPTNATCRSRTGCRPRHAHQSQLETAWARDLCDRRARTFFTNRAIRDHFRAFPRQAAGALRTVTAGVTLSDSGLYADSYVGSARWHPACNSIRQFKSPHLGHRGETLHSSRPNDRIGAPFRGTVGWTGLQDEPRSE